jgi:heat shock protein HslJ
MERRLTRRSVVRPPRLVVPLVIAVSSAACGGGSGSTSDDLAPLNGDWVLTAGSDADGPLDLGDGDVEVTLTIDGSAWGGQVCNIYGADGVDVDDGSVRIGDVSRTEMGCLDDRLMVAEDRYLTAFVEVSSYALTEGELRLTGDGTELVYAPVAAEADADLIGTVWLLDTVITGTGPEASVSSVVGGAATLELAADGSYTFGTGCNSGGGSYELDGDRLVFPQGASGATEVGCEGELGAQEEHVYAVLTDGVVDVDLAGQRLTLTAGDLGLSYTAS